MAGRVLVTGAAGLAGGIVVRAFARRGAPVRALVRNRARAGALASLPGVDLVEGDMARADTLGAALEGVERALVCSTADEQMRDTQCAFADACRAAGVAHLVKLSGLEAGVGFRPEHFRFARMHTEIERHIEATGLAWTHLQPSQFMQVYLREARDVAAHGELRQPLGQSRNSPVDLEDVAGAALAVLLGEGHAGKAYPMTGPESLTGAEVAERLARAIGRPGRFVDVAPEEKRRALLAAGAPPARADAMDELFAERRRCLESRVDLSTHQALGVRPTYFEEFARRSAAAFRGDAPPA